VYRRDEREWKCKLNGPVDGLISWLVDKPVEDLTVGQPDLESLFRRYYQHGPGPRETGDTE
jgi:hypothetical protein